jgi:RNA polymerase sigma factor (sigma-70 family)
LWVLEQGEIDETLAEQTDAYVTWGAVHSGVKRAACASRAYSKYVEAEPTLASDEDEDIDWIETLAGSSTNPEALFIENEDIYRLSKAIAELTPTNQKLVTMLYQRYNQNEISEALGIGKSAVSQRKATIERQLAELLI